MKFRIRSTVTGLWLVAPVTNWEETCKPDWTDIQEAAYQFTPVAANDQISYLSWNVNHKAKRCRVPVPYVRSTKKDTNEEPTTPAQ